MIEEDGKESYQRVAWNEENDPYDLSLLLRSGPIPQMTVCEVGAKRYIDEASYSGEYLEQLDSRNVSRCLKHM
jgi:hypothetical protein